MKSQQWHKPSDAHHCILDTKHAPLMLAQNESREKYNYETMRDPEGKKKITFSNKYFSNLLLKTTVKQFCDILQQSGSLPHNIEKKINIYFFLLHNELISTSSFLLSLLLLPCNPLQLEDFPLPVEDNMQRQHDYFLLHTVSNTLTIYIILFQIISFLNLWCLKLTLYHTQPRITSAKQS